MSDEKPEPRTRRPAGVAAWPAVLVEGPDQIAAARVAYQIAASERIGRTFVADLGGGLADEFDALGEYEVLDLNGTYPDLLTQLRLAADVEPDALEDKPNAIVLDSVSDLWGLVNDWGDAKARNSNASRALLADDPDASIARPADMWNAIDARWTDVVQVLRRFPGVGVLIARGFEGDRGYQVEGARSLPSVVNAWLHVEGDRVEVRGSKTVMPLDLDLDVDGLTIELPGEEPEEWGALEFVVFKVLGVRGFAPLRVRQAHVGLLKTAAQRRLKTAVARLSTKTGDDLKTEARRWWDLAELDRFGDELPHDALDEVLDLLEEEYAP